MRLRNLFLSLLLAVFFITALQSQPNWPAIKSNATFIIHDSTYDAPYLQPLNVGGWEDGLCISRDGLSLYCLYLPADVISLFSDFYLDPVCFNFVPYFRPPLLGIDTLTNPWNCPNFFQTDVMISQRASVTDSFTSWMPSNMAMSVSNEGAPQMLPKNADSVDVMVYTRNGDGTQDMDIMFMKNVPNNPNQNTSVSIVTSIQNEDNPHIERISANQLVLLFDRERSMYYSISHDNGATWQTPVLITNVLNDFAPYDVQPHLWNDGNDWWVYYCAPNASDVRCIYKSKQQIANDWNSWGPRELVIEPGGITGGAGIIAGIGEPTLTQQGDISFVVIYADVNSADTTDVFDADPWFLPKKGSTMNVNKKNKNFDLVVYPNPASSFISIQKDNGELSKITVFNVLGDVVLSKKLAYNEDKIDVGFLDSGIYYIQSENQIGQERCTKIIVIGD